MVLRNTLICSTCGNRITIRCQVGYVEPVAIRIACDQCSKIIKGYFTSKNEKGFVFPNDRIEIAGEHTKQTVNLSSEFPIMMQSLNTPMGFSPFLIMNEFIGFKNTQLFLSQTGTFIGLYDSKFVHLSTISEIFEKKNWKYFLIEAKKQFAPNLPLNFETFEDCAFILTEIQKPFYELLSTEFYQKTFTKEILSKTIDRLKIIGSSELKALKVELSKVINIENEFIGGVQLTIKFLENVKSFFPVIALTYNNDFNKKYRSSVHLTTFDFLDLKDLYIEQFEYLSRISSVYFGIINLSERNNVNNFGAIKECKTLIDYYKKSNGIKKDIIKQSPVLDHYFSSTMDNLIRNAIGHQKVTYDTKAQLIKYFPYKDMDKKDIYQEIFLVDFANIVYQQALKVSESLLIIADFLLLTK